MKQSQKKFWCLVLSIMLFASMFGMFSINAAATSASKAEPIVETSSRLMMWGDVNLNNNIEIKDATMIQEHLAKIITLSGDEYLCGCVDQKSTLDIKDVTIIQKYLAKIFYDSTFVSQMFERPTDPSTVMPTDAPTDATIVVPTYAPGAYYIIVHKTQSMGDVLYAYAYNEYGDNNGPYPGKLMQDYGDNFSIMLPLMRYPYYSYDKIVFSDGNLQSKVYDITDVWNEYTISLQ
ncbi:MAG: hypothetical protein Q8876_05865 [Bacillota bacterium]|nr:hypothetical protein [Bacillota bacterium]